MTETEKMWSERVRAWRASGRTAEQFVPGRGFKASTLRYWASRLRPKTAHAPERESTPVRFMRVRPTAMPARSASATGSIVVIAIGEARIEVRPGFDRRLLSDIVEALGGAR